MCAMFYTMCYILCTMYYLSVHTPRLRSTRLRAASLPTKLLRTEIRRFKLSGRSLLGFENPTPQDKDSARAKPSEIQSLSTQIGRTSRTRSSSLSRAGLKAIAEVSRRMEVFAETARNSCAVFAEIFGDCESFSETAQFTRKFESDPPKSNYNIRSHTILYYTILYHTILHYSMAILTF